LEYAAILDTYTAVRTPRNTKIMHFTKKQNSVLAFVNVHIHPFSNLAKQTNHSMLVFV